MKESRQTHILQRVANQLSASAKHVFSANDLVEFLDDLRAKGVLPKSPSSHKIHQLIIDSGIVQPIKLTATYTFESKRYHRGPFSPYELALSLKPDSYLSHSTAVFLHQLSDHQSNIIYANKEQSPKGSSGDLTQAGINRAFSTKQRTSGFQVHHGLTTIILLNGKHSGRLGVAAMQGPNGEQLVTRSPVKLHPSSSKNQPPTPYRTHPQIKFPSPPEAALGAGSPVKGLRCAPMNGKTPRP